MYTQCMMRYHNTLFPTIATACSEPRHISEYQRNHSVSPPLPVLVGGDMHMYTTYTAKKRMCSLSLRGPLIIKPKRMTCTFTCAGLGLFTLTGLNNITYRIRIVLQVLTVRKEKHYLRNVTSTQCSFCSANSRILAIQEQKLTGTFNLHRYKRQRCKKNLPPKKIHGTCSCSSIL